jgi:hypothetical protein
MRLDGLFRRQEKPKMRRLIREETTTVVKVYEADEDELALGGAAET